MSKESTEECCYVRATCNYRYPHKGKEVSMTKDEVFLLIKKTTDDWWQVIRSGDKKTFFAPSKYLETTDISIDAMKSSLRKKIAHQRHLQNQQRLYHESRKHNTSDPTERADSPDIHLLPEENFCQIKENSELQTKAVIDPPRAFLDANKNESLVGNNSNKNNNRHNNNNNTKSYSRDHKIHCAAKTTSNISFTSDGNEDCDTILNKSPDSFQGSFKSVNVFEKISLCGSPEKHGGLSSEFESTSTHTSKSSLNDCSRSSIESFSQIKIKGLMMGKAASFDVLQADDDNISLIKGSYQKAASSEELDNRNRRKEFLFQSDRLSHRNRSNSVELKRFDNNLDLSECEKLTSLEKRKCRITRDPMNRRRSWALNESPSYNSYSKSRGNDLDASVILDMPPKLPPKLKKITNLHLSSSSDNLYRSENFIDERNEEGLSRLCTENFSDISFKDKKFKPFSFPKRPIPSSEDSDSDEKLLGYHEDDQLDRDKVPGKLSGWKKIQSALANEKLVRSMGDERREDIHSLKEKRVEELIERIENQSKMVEKPSSPRPKIQFQPPPTPTDPPRRIVFEDWGEHVDTDSGRPYYFNPKTSEKRWKPPRKSVCSTIITDNVPSISSEKFSSTKSIKVPSPVLPPNSNLVLWPNRERSFTNVSPSTSGGNRVLPTLSLNPDKMSHTLPANPQPINSSLNVPKGSHTLPPHPGSPKDPSPTPKSSRSFFSAISSSLSFIKHSGGSHGNPASTNNSDCPSPASSHSPPQAPPSSAKPQLGGSNCSTPATPSSLESLNEEPEQVTLQLALERFHIPRGWSRKYDALSHQVYFESLVTGEKWNPAIDKCGTIYVYSASGGESKWNLQEYEDVSPSSLPSSSILSFEREKEQALREDILIWRLTMKEGKKAKKSWSTSYAKYYPNLKKNIFGKSFGSITFAKKLNDNKKVECFDLVPPCFIDFNLKKQNSLCLRNGDQTEVFIQADTPTIATEWVKLLIEYDKVQEKNLSAEKEKKSSRNLEKSQSKKDPPDDAEVTKGIKDSLMLFFKRRIQQETLAKKGIYKDTVFGSTISDLCQKEQLNTPVFVLQCIKNIEKNKENFTMDGLYRISGNASKIQKIRIEIAQNRYGILEEEKDVHNLTGALKLFFRELKEPLIPFANYPYFINATDHMKTKIRIEALRQAVRKLPTCNRETLKILLDHLLKVNEYEQENRMSIMNLAIVFGPCLLWPETTSGFDLMTDAMLHNRVVESLLSLFDDIFRKK